MVIGPGGGRDLLSALAFGATRVDGVEINPIIVRDVMLDRFRAYSGGIYQDPRVTIHVDDGRSFVRRSPMRYDVIQASLVDTWAATAAGAYTLTENSLYTAEAFGEYRRPSQRPRPSDDHALGVRWSPPGVARPGRVRRRGLDPSKHLAIVRFDRVATFLLKKTPFTDADVSRLQQLAHDLEFTILYAPGVEPDPISAEPAEMARTGTSAADYRRLILAGDRERFLADIRSTSGRRLTTGPSSSTRRDWRTSSTSPSAKRCSSATGSAHC